VVLIVHHNAKMYLCIHLPQFLFFLFLFLFRIHAVFSLHFLFLRNGIQNLSAFIPKLSIDPYQHLVTEAVTWASVCSVTPICPPCWLLCQSSLQATIYNSLMSSGWISMHALCWNGTLYICICTLNHTKSLCKCILFVSSVFVQCQAFKPPLRAFSTHLSVTKSRRHGDFTSQVWWKELVVKAPQQPWATSHPLYSSFYCRKK